MPRKVEVDVTVVLHVLDSMSDQQIKREVAKAVNNGLGVESAHVTKIS